MEEINSFCTKCELKDTCDKVWNLEKMVDLDKEYDCVIFKCKRYSVLT